jgi:osmotically-inducible protein OsmY
MKMTFRVLTAVASGALLLPALRHELKAGEVLPQVVGKGHKAPAHVKTPLLSNSSSSKAQSLNKAEDAVKLSHGSQEVASERFISRSEQTNEEVSPFFQVSSDPRDQVRFLVNKGIVTVQGSVATRELARKLIKQYTKMPGVRAVRNRLTVRTNNDAEVATQLREALSNDPDTNAGRIAVTVSDGVVFLSGAISSAQESERAEKLAWDLQGVRRVNNGLRIAGQNRYTVQATSGATRRR